MTWFFDEATGIPISSGFQSSQSLDGERLAVNGTQLRQVLTNRRGYGVCGHMEGFTRGFAK